ncbi:hypothetical protein [Mycobacterium sp. ITM-2016-00318]|uniref:hypothetical protein n=1 Tax=Mycobacterium sp. ITM-2016-00318 TaxID=2099693 RepID=UPI00115882ED|nr:hypothetical protein [Mycobacterium sp. ITM-2016-00318]WNG92965.1 hypothetical protein C6A82_000215 [Mycobacterium sp. ITM-2016-00318]
MPPTEAPSDYILITPELVAKTIAGIPLIGYARRALENAGLAATVVANRITISGAVEAQLTSSNGSVWWQVYAVDGTPPAWTVGIETETMSSWTGC